MKTAISIPDETFAAADRSAAELGVSRSEFYTTAARRYLDDLDAESVTARIDAVLDTIGVDDSTVVAVASSRKLLAADDEW